MNDVDSNKSNRENSYNTVGAMLNERNYHTERFIFEIKKFLYMATQNMDSPRLRYSFGHLDECGEFQRFGLNFFQMQLNL